MTNGQTRARARWVSWVFGLALLVAVVVFAVHHIEEMAFAHLVFRARPAWLLLGLLLLLLVVMRAPERLFRSGWFVESVVSATLIVLVVRTRHPLHRSRPGRLLTTAVLAVVVATLVLPYVPGAELLGFQHLPPLFYLTLGAVILAYVLSAEVAKRWFYVGNLDAAGVVPRRAVQRASRRR